MAATEHATSRGAKAALDGFEYQLSVSVFVALRLLLITKSATQITIEPASEEDLEADLESARPGRVQPSANTGAGYRLVVQVKHRNSGPWSIRQFDALLNHGAARQPAKCHLDDPDTRYLLITNADVAGVARKLLVCGLEEWPEEKGFPPSLSSTLPNGPEGRIAIWGGLGERLLDLEIDDVLRSLLRVPHSWHARCRARLRGEVLRRMRGTSPGVWTREDLLGVIRDSGGYLASSPQLESFVPPANYRTLLNRLEQDNALVLTGPSGTGKTWTAVALLDQARQRPSAPEIIEVNVNEGPSSTRTLSDPGPKVFYVEDPWGLYSLRGGADVWTEQLPRLLREAHPAHQYVITSRTDMLEEARADEKLRRWTAVLDAEQYRDGELADIYDKRLLLLPTDLQAKALAFQTDALDALEIPFEVDQFFKHLADGPEKGEVDPAFYRRILALAHREAVEDVVVSYLVHSNQAGASAIVWALLAARSRFDRNQLISLSRQLRTSALAPTTGLEKLVDRLVATRHLSQPSQTVRFLHPSVRAGFETFIMENWELCEGPLTSLVAALTQLDSSQQDWGIETAARSLKAIADLVAGAGRPGLEFEPESASRDAIDTWLEESLLDRQANFGPVLQLASDVGSQKSTPSELSRWFIEGIRRGGAFFVDDWKPPAFDDAWYARISTDSRSFTIADRFVREQLPDDQGDIGADFVGRLDRIAGGLTPAFVAAARKVVTYGLIDNVKAVAVGAVRDLGRYQEVLYAALDELAELKQWHEREGREQWRAIDDGECDEGHEEAYESQHAEDGYAASVLVEAYVDEVRSLGQWKTLAQHPRSPELGRAWAKSISLTNQPVTPEELRTVITITHSSKDEESVWEAVRQRWHPSLSADLERRVLSEPPDDRLRAALAYCALTRSPVTLARCIERAATASATLVQILVDVNAAFDRISRKSRARSARPVLASLSPLGQEIFEALSVDDEPPQAVGGAALLLLEEAAKTVPPFALDKIVPVTIASGAAPAAAIGRWLIETEDRQLAKAAAESAIRIQDDTLVWVALDHSRADARVVALTNLANSLPDPLPRRLLELSSDRSSRVRRSLVGILSDRPHPDHQPELLRLIDDDWSDADVYNYDRPTYPIAREAIVGLRAYGDLSDEVGEALLLRAERTDERSLGIVALDTAAQCCGATIRQRIWALSFLNEPRWVRVDAIDALTRADAVETHILDAITARLLLQLAPPLAASAVVLLATHGQVDTAVKAMERMAHSAKRRALLLLGAWCLADRDRNAADGLLALLESDHPARRLLDLRDGEQLPSGALNDLGHIRIQRAVQRWLHDRIA